MYIYYVRYSIYDSEGEKIAEGNGEVSLESPILYYEEIEIISDVIKEEFKKSEMPEAEMVIIDFYNFLRQE